MVSGNGMWDNKYSVVRPAVIKKLYGQTNKIIPVAGYKCSFLASCKDELFEIRGFKHSNVMGTHAIDPLFPYRAGYLGAQILVQVEFHIALPSR